MRMYDLRFTMYDFSQGYFVFTIYSLNINFLPALVILFINCANHD